MFEIKSFLKKTKAINQDNSANFLSNINSIKEDVSTKNNISSSQSEYNQFYVNGIDFLRLFSESQNNENNFLEQAAECFIQCLELKKTKAEPNFYLAYIAYLMNNIDLALKYLKFTTYLDPDMPEIKILSELITNRISHNEQRVINNNNVSDNNDSKDINTDMPPRSLKINRVNRIKIT